MTGVSRVTVQKIRKDYMEGMTLLALGRKYSWVPRRLVRQCLEGIIRPKSRPVKADPSEEEIAEKRDAINRSWTPEQARLRWVGRYATKPETLGSCLSRAIREMGGDA